MKAVHGDFRAQSLETAPTLVLTDPPYNLGHNYGDVSDRLPQGEYVQLLKDASRWAFDKTAPDAWFVVIHRPEFFFMHGKECILDAGWEVVQRIAWCYPSNVGHSKRKFTTSSRDIWVFKKGDPFFDSKADAEPYQNPDDKRVRALIEAGSPGRAPYDWWQIDLQKNVGKDHAGYANQLPRPLLRRFILSMTRPGEVVADPFGGTGSVAKEADRLGRDGWTCDLNGSAPCLETVAAWQPEQTTEWRPDA